MLICKSPVRKEVYALIIQMDGNCKKIYERSMGYGLNQSWQTAAEEGAYKSIGYCVSCKFFSCRLFAVSQSDGGV